MFRACGAQRLEGLGYRVVGGGGTGVAISMLVAIVVILLVTIQVSILIEIIQLLRHVRW